MSSVGNVSVRQFTVNVKGTSVTITHNLNDKYLVRFFFLIQNNHLFTKHVYVMYILHIQCIYAKWVNIGLIERCLLITKLIMISIP